MRWVAVAGPVVAAVLAGCGLSAASGRATPAPARTHHAAVERAHHPKTTAKARRASSPPIVPAVKTSTTPPVPQPVMAVEGTPTAGSTVVLQVSNVPSGYVLVTLAMNEGANTITTPLASAQSNAQNTAASGFSVSPDGAIIRFAFDMAMGGGRGQFVLTYQDSAGKRLAVDSSPFTVQG